MELPFHVYITNIIQSIIKIRLFFGQKPNYLYHGNSNISSKSFFGISDLW